MSFLDFVIRNSNKVLSSKSKTDGAYNSAFTFTRSIDEPDNTIECYLTTIQGAAEIYEFEQFDDDTY